MRVSLVWAKGTPRQDLAVLVVIPTQGHMLSEDDGKDSQGIIMDIGRPLRG
jgi:hypothetical protein